jgi:hypothetical protein
MEHDLLLFVKKNQHPKTKTLYLIAIYIKVSFVHFLGQCRRKEKLLKKAVIELQRAKVPNSTIRRQLKMLKSPWGGS